MVVFNEETEKVKHDAVVHGLPKLRFVVASRNSLGGVSEAHKILEPVLDALTRPLTPEEKEKGKWAPKHSRILFEGTLPEAEEFYNQTIDIPRLLGAPFSKYTDGLPVVIPPKTAWQLCSRAPAINRTN